MGRKGSLVRASFSTLGCRALALARVGKQSTSLDKEEPMYGLVNKAVQDLIVTQFGENKWEAIKEEAEIDIESFVSMNAYPASRRGRCTRGIFPASPTGER